RRWRRGSTSTRRGKTDDLPIFKLLPESHLMNRRFFSKFMALGAGSLGFWQVAADGTEGKVAAPAGALDTDAAKRDAALPTDGHPREPVNVAEFQALAKGALPQATYEYI